MYELNDLNPDVMRAEVDYRRARLTAQSRRTTSGIIRRIRRSRTAQAPID